MSTGGTEGTEDGNKRRRIFKMGLGNRGSLPRMPFDAAAVSVGTHRGDNGDRITCGCPAFRKVFNLG